MLNINLVNHFEVGRQPRNKLFLEPFVFLISYELVSTVCDLVINLHERSLEHLKKL